MIRRPDAVAGTVGTEDVVEREPSLVVGTEENRRWIDVKNCLLINVKNCLIYEVIAGVETGCR